MKANEQFQVTLEAARRYERVAVRHILGPWAPLLIDAVLLQPGRSVLDVACGTGVVARLAAQRVGPRGRVTGVDLNAGMIGVARSLPPPDGAAIDWLEGSALALPLPDASVDAVLCQQGLQFFPDKALALREMRRVARREGRLALSVWSAVGPYHTAVGEALARFVDATTATSFRASRKVPGKDELERLAATAGWSEVKVSIGRLNVHLPGVERFVVEHLAATPVAAAIAAADAETRENIGASVKRAMERFADGDGVTYPEETHVLTARAREEAR
ncbi:MAG TPA: methyltransferase domain-containing protein [Burkholderiales bacterium]|jgi:ubiquinone/menaquinone biosynthesis C-methylase UbiE